MTKSLRRHEQVLRITTFIIVCLETNTEGRECRRGCDVLRKLGRRRLTVRYGKLTDLEMKLPKTPSELSFGWMMKFVGKVGRC